MGVSGMSNILDGLTIDDVINNNKDAEINIETLDDTKVELMQKKIDDGSIFELTLKEIFSYLDLSYVDKRDKKGALWVIGDNSLNDLMQLFEKHGFKFIFSSKGGRASKNMPAWFTTAKGDRLSPDGTTEQNYEIIKNYGYISDNTRPICINYMRWYNNPPAFDISEWNNTSCEKPGKGIVLNKEEILKLRDVLREDTIFSKDELLQVIDLGNASIDDYGLVTVLNDKGNWSTEARVIDWGYKKGLDIRKWDHKHTKCGKGVNLKQSELEKLIAILDSIEL